MTPLPSAPIAPAPRLRGRWPLIAVLVLSLLGAMIVAEPLAIALVLGCVMAVSAQQPYHWLTRRLGERSGLAAVLTTIGFGLLVGVAGSAVLIALTNELIRLVGLFDEYARLYGSASLTHALGPRLSHAVEQAGLDPERVTAWAQRQLESAAGFAASSAAVILRATSQVVLDLVVALMTMYYVLRDGHGLTARLERVLPLEPRHTRALLVEARDVSRTAFIGTLVTAAVQGLIAGLGYAALDVPQPVTWAVATALASFIPVAGTLLVWVPVSGYLILSGHPARAGLMVVWGIFAVTMLADYYIRPRIVGRHGHSHPLLTLISLLGGIEVFGLAGLVIAPIVMSLFVAALRLYEREGTGNRE